MTSTKKVLTLISFGAGYVLGAKAGRGRYEQLRGLALRVKDDPHVQHAVEETAEFTRQEGSAAVHKVAEEVGVHQAVGFNGNATP